MSTLQQAVPLVAAREKNLALYENPGETAERKRREAEQVAAKQAKHLGPYLVAIRACHAAGAGPDANLIALAKTAGLKPADVDADLAALSKYPHMLAGYKALLAKRRPIMAEGLAIDAARRHLLDIEAKRRAYSYSVSAGESELRSWAHMAGARLDLQIADDLVQIKTEDSELFAEEKAAFDQQGQYMAIDSATVIRRPKI